MTEAFAQNHDIIEDQDRDNIVHLPRPQPWNAGDGMWNDAALYGGPCPEFDRLMQQRAEITLGFQYEGERPKGKRDTKKGSWNSSKKPWFVLAEGTEANPSLNVPVAGFTRHGVSDRKDGMAYVLGVCDGGFRTAESMSRMYAIGLDYDLNIDLDDLIARIKDLKIAGFLYTTFNNGTDTVTVAASSAVKASDGSKITIDGVRHVLRARGFDEPFLQQVEMLPDTVIKEGKRYVACRCPKITKARFIAPLTEPVDLTKLADDPKQAAAMYSARVRGLSQMIGFQHDAAAEDCSRLFYIGAHPKAATEDDYHVGVFRAPPIRWDDIPVVEKPNRRGLSKGESIPQDVTVEVDGKSINVTDLYYRYGKRWNLTDILPVDRLQEPSSDGEGEVIECPFHGDHSSDEIGTGTVAYDPDPDADLGSKHFATIHCSHTCGELYHLIHHLAKLLEEGEIQPEDLEDSAYMIPFGEGQQEEKFFRRTPDEISELKEPPTDADGNALSLDDRCAGFDKSSKEADIQEFLNTLVVEEIDVTDRARATEMLVERTVLGKRDLNRMWQTADRVQRKIEADQAKAELDQSNTIMVDADFHDQTEAAQAAIDARNAVDPFLFVRNNTLCAVVSAEGTAMISQLTTLGMFGCYLNTTARFAKRQGENGRVGTSAPHDVRDHLFYAPKGEYPTLDKVSTTPFFSAYGLLVTEPGYHPETRTYFDPGGFVVPAVAQNPTEAEMKAAVNLLVDLVAQFPFAGITDGDEMRKQFWDHDKGGVPALVHYLSALLTMFARDLFGRIAPGLLINKPAPGTGASLLVDLFSIIATGRKVGAHKPSAREEEFAKALAGFIEDGRPITYLDNINFPLDSSDLAAAQTAERYSPRMLGKNDVSELDVNTQFILTANGLVMSAELIRRSLLCDLDPKRADPENRDGFDIEDPAGQVTDNRAEYVHACLTVIQYWISKGMPKGAAKLASFETWSRNLSGLWDACGVPGFMGNEDAKKEACQTPRVTMNRHSLTPLRTRPWLLPRSQMAMKSGFRMGMRPGSPTLSTS